MPWLRRKTRKTSSSVSPARYRRTPFSNRSSSCTMSGSSGRAFSSLTSMAMVPSSLLGGFDQEPGDLGAAELDRRELPGGEQLAHLGARQVDVLGRFVRAGLGGCHRPARVAEEGVLEEHR